MEDQEVPYQYNPISASEEIRVLRLEPGAFDEPLIGSLAVQKIADDETSPPAYDCVSYCWGPQEQLKTFTCDGRSLRITVAVDGMLRNLRKSVKPRRLWVDASTCPRRVNYIDDANSNIVCINQAADEEKSQQVHTMDRIYAQARKVRIWLGPAPDGDFLAISPLFGFGQWGSKITYRVIDLGKITAKRLSAKSTSFCQLVEDLLSRAWFTRRWVLQEVAFARVPMVHCGHHKATWTQFCDGVFKYICYAAEEQRKGNDSAITRGAIHTIGFVYNMKRSRANMLPGHGCNSSGDSLAFGTLLDLLRDYDVAECVDNRDRLYALYGMSLGVRLHNKHQSKLMKSCPVDYSMHFSHTYTNLAAAAIGSGHTDKVIQHVFEFGGLDQQEESWPSWVPSWNEKKNFSGTERVVTYQTRRPRSLDEVTHLAVTYPPKERKLWTTNDVRITEVYGSRALRLNGCIYRIGGVQLSAGDVDATTYFQTALSRRYCGGQDPLAQTYHMAWLITMALEYVPELHRHRKFNRDDSLKISDSSFLHYATRRFLGLPLEKYPEEQFDLDEDHFRSELRRVLEGLYLFSYECDGSPEIGITTAEVRPGDFVFRTTEALSQDTEDGPLLPSLCGWLIRPYHQSSSTGPATFRLLGWCIDYYPDVKDPEIVEVILV